MSDSDRPGFVEAVEAAARAIHERFDPVSSKLRPSLERAEVAIDAAYPVIEQAVRTEPITAHYENAALIRADERARIVVALREFHDPEARHDCMATAADFIERGTE